MTHQFRPRKDGNSGGNNNNNNNGNGRRRRPGGGNRDGLPKNDAAELEGLPEIDFNHFDKMTPAALLKEAKAAKIDPKKMLRHELIEALVVKANPDVIYAKGILEMIQDFGFLRRENYHPGPNDVYVSQSQIKRFNLRCGDVVNGMIRLPKEGEKYPGMIRVESVNSLATDSQEMQKRVVFDELTPLYPNERIMMETISENIPQRIMDLISPIGKGQRGLIVAPPKAGNNHDDEDDR